jgi:hypothetical protein
MTKETVLCSHCKFTMEDSQTVYAIPESKHANWDESRIDLTKAINVQILRCSNPECDFIELKAPKRWPSFGPLQS